VSEWQPIETAPKCGKFLVWIPSTQLPWPAHADEKSLWSNAHGRLNATNEFTRRPIVATHWMPFPEPPP
jgi:hypothetical protein